MLSIWSSRCPKLHPSDNSLGSPTNHSTSNVAGTVFWKKFRKFFWCPNITQSQPHFLVSWVVLICLEKSTFESELFCSHSATVEWFSTIPTTIELIKPNHQHLVMMPSLLSSLLLVVRQIYISWMKDFPQKVFLVFPRQFLYFLIIRLLIKIDGATPFFVYMNGPNEPIVFEKRIFFANHFGIVAYIRL